jgi:peptide/nickel transport system permease protein
MTGFLLRRGAMMVVTLFVSSFVIYSAMYLAPGDPLSALAGNRPLTPEAKAVLTARYHLDEPFLQRYWRWLSGVFHGDLGYSITRHQSVSDLIGGLLGTTVFLVLYAGVIILVVGIGLGIIGGLRRGAVDGGVILISTLSAAIPSFVAAIVLLLIFAVNLGWFPVSGIGMTSSFPNMLWHLSLPAWALAIATMAVVARVTRTSVREEQRKEHVQTAISRGIPYHYVVRRHVLRNAAIPILTVSGLTIASLIAVAAVVERAFNVNGLGSALLAAANSGDMAVVQGISLILVFAFIFTNTIVDVLYAVLDPRVALGEKAT